MHRYLLSASLVSFGLVAACLGGCSSDSGGTGGGGGIGGGHTHADACEYLAELCHEKDTGSGVPHDCHELAHNPATTAEQCEAKEAECEAACK